MSQTQSVPSTPFSIPIAPEMAATWRELAESEWPATATWTTPEGQLAVDVYVAEDAVVVRTAVAGVRPEDLSISFHNDLLTIRGRRQQPEQAAEGHYVVQECHWGVFSRSILLPVPIRPEEVEAIMKNGILTIILPRVPTIAVAIRLELSDEGYA